MDLVADAQQLGKRDVLSFFNLQPEKVIYVWMLLPNLTPSAGLKGNRECLSAPFSRFKSSFRG